MNTDDLEFQRFVRTRAAPLHRTAYLLSGDWHLAHDLVQDTLAKAYKHWSRVRKADSPDAYVRRILVNEANRAWGRRGPPTTLSARIEADKAVSTPDSADEVVTRAALLNALMALPARQRATVVLRYLDGLSERETAAALQCSEGTVKSQTARALNSLQSLLNREELKL